MIKKAIAGLLIVFVAPLWFFILSPDYHLFVIRGESMLPTITCGSWVIARAPSGVQEIESGMIIAHTVSKRGKILHRVIGVDAKEEEFITKGDGNSYPDPWIVPFSDIKGVYLFHIPFIGRFSLLGRQIVQNFAEKER